MPTQSSTLQLDLALVGFGHVAREFVRLLAEKRQTLERDAGLTWGIVGIVTRRHGGVWDPGGLDVDRALELAERGLSLDSMQGSSDEPPPSDAFELIARLQAEEARPPQTARTDNPSCPVLVETTILDIQSGQPAIDHVRAALRAGVHVVTANKGPVAFAYRELRDLADTTGVCFFFEGAVMDGIPIFNLVRETLPATEIRGFRGVVNSTTNYILTAMEEGREFDRALAEMQAAGIAEQDASLDLDGWDAAAKAAALANVWMAAALTPQQVTRTGIRSLTGTQVRAAVREGTRIKLVASAARQPDGRVTATVAPVELPARDPLAQLAGMANALIIDVDPLGRIVIGELDGGLTQTAYALLSDLVAVRRRLSAHRAAPPHQIL